jgi:hypothetical protein
MKRLKFNTIPGNLTAKAAKKAQRKSLCSLVGLVVNISDFSSPQRHKEAQNNVQRFFAS